MTTLKNEAHKNYGVNFYFDTEFNIKSAPCTIYKLYIYDVRNISYKKILNSRKIVHEAPR